MLIGILLRIVDFLSSSKVLILLSLSEEFMEIESFGVIGIGGKDFLDYVSWAWVGTTFDALETGIVTPFRLTFTYLLTFSSISFKNSISFLA